MPDTREHRGPNPADAKLFAPEKLPMLRLAASEYCWLLTRGYAAKSSLKIVGDRYDLDKRQRLALMRSCCSQQQAETRHRHMLPIDAIKDRMIVIDGYNLLITIEAAISGALIMKGSDGCLRDLASIHGTYKKVHETLPAIELIGHFLEKYQPSEVLWLLDSPVSNSGRLKLLILKQAVKNNWNWKVELVFSPDAAIIKSHGIAVSSDSVILDACASWINLATAVIEKEFKNKWLIDLSTKIDVS